MGWLCAATNYHIVEEETCCTTELNCNTFARTSYYILFVRKLPCCETLLCVERNGITTIVKCGIC